ncbi:unnamed protein product [Ectocarpus sp. 13 AM-2016]
MLYILTKVQSGSFNLLQLLDLGINRRVVIAVISTAPCGSSTYTRGCVFTWTIGMYTRRIPDFYRGQQRVSNGTRGIRSPVELLLRCTAYPLCYKAVLVTQWIFCTS